MADFIPLITFDYKLAFCQATNNLPTDVQRIIWNKTLDVEPPSVPPPAPIKPSRRLNRLMEGWKARRQL
jgi:hypothetical protein